MEIMFGDLSALESIFDVEYLCIRIHNTKEDPDTPQRSMFQSDTICPQLFTDAKKPRLAIYDCPGFADTRGTSNEIATGVYLSEIVRHAKRVKLVVAVDYDTVKPNADRNKFTDSVLPEVLDFVLNNDIYQGGVFLLVTKYGNPNEDSNNQFSDEDITFSIARFLKAAQKHAVASAKDIYRKSSIKALFENSWLQMVDGKYQNIGFSRTITKEGKLSDMESVTRRTRLRHQLLYNSTFVFKPCLPKDFGCPISDAAKLEIRKVKGSLEHKAQEILNTMGQKVVQKFSHSSKDAEQLSNFLHQYLLFSNDTKKLPQANSGLSIKSLELLSKFSNNVKVDIKLEINLLIDIVKRLSHLSSVDVEESSATSKLNQAMLSMAKDLLIEFRKAQRDLTAESNLLLKLLCQQVVINFAKSNGTNFDNISSNKQVPVPRLSDTSLLDILGKLRDILGDVILKTEVNKLEAIIKCFKYLTEVDVEQSSTTWSEVHSQWTHTMEMMKKDIVQLKTQKDLIEAKTSRELAKAKAKQKVAETNYETALADAKSHAKISVVRAKTDLIEAESIGGRAEAIARKRLKEAKAHARKFSQRSECVCGLCSDYESDSC